jgi:hypothetical protein
MMDTDDGKTMQCVEVNPTGRLKRRLGGQGRLTVPAGQSVQTMLAGLNVDPRSTMGKVNGRWDVKE